MATKRKVKHTAGPWKVNIDGTQSGRWPFIFTEAEEYEGGGFRQLAELETVEVNDSSKSRQNWKRREDAAEIEANARLMAAAPELLAALKVYLNAGHKEARRLASIQAKAAIAKAEECEISRIKNL